MTIVVAIDPGLADDSCGYARLAVDGNARRLIDAHALCLDSLDAMTDRMTDVTNRVSDQLRAADLLVLEDQQPAAFVTRGRQNKHSARLQELVSMLRAVALVMSKPCVVVTPQKVRSVLGLPANATKTQCWWTVSCMFRERRAELPKSKHVRDAIVLAVVGEKIWRADAVRGKERVA